MPESLGEEFQMLAGRTLTLQLADRLTQVLKLEPTFAAAACVDVVRGFEQLLKSQTDADATTIEIACSTFAAAIYNANSNYRCKMVYEEPQEQTIK